MTGKAVIKEAFGRHKAVLEESEKEILSSVEDAADLIFAALKGGGKVLTCGNGGSAADAQHFAAELVCKYRDDRQPLSAVALTTDTSAITAIANDYGFEQVFSRQVEALGREGDVLVAITTSGKSPNVLRAIEAAKKKKVRVVALTGARGRELKQVCDVAVAVPSEEAARIQEIHEIVIHAWCEYVDGELSAKSK